MTELNVEDNFMRLNAEDYGELAASPRRRAREAALLMLYQLDFGGNEPPMTERTLADISLDDESAAFARELVARAQEHQAASDARVAGLSREWVFERLFNIDVTILRLALGEIFGGDTPANIIINEAVELAKKFGEAASPAFVNAVLDAVYQQRQAEEAP